MVFNSTVRLLKNKHNLAISNFGSKALDYHLVLCNYPENTDVPGVSNFTLHNLGAASLKAMVSARVKYVNKSMAGTLTEKDKCNQHLYVESWSEEDKAADSNIQDKVAIITNIAGAGVVLANGMVPKSDDSASGETATAAKDTPAQLKKGTTTLLAKTTTVHAKKATVRTMSLYQNDNTEDKAEEGVTPCQPHSSAVSTSGPWKVPGVPNVPAPSVPRLVVQPLPL
ncbi:hypothetical protein V5O48_019124 [Marasmius crinis-equi]|uniref:Uncharacterized protein n=1 Tax=Marasmius crinis-equi TaxID=585013 RepID=A0ABR3EJD4_9AGAR